MKTICLGILAATACLATFAQEAPKAAKSEVEVIAPEALRPSSVDTNALSAPKPEAGKTDQRRVKRSGLLAGWKKGDKPSKIFSLRNPADPQRDAENLLTDLPTETRRGIKLFSLDF